LHETSLELLKRKHCGRNERPFTIYAETDLADGKAVALKMGFEKAESETGGSEHLYVLTSEMSDAKLVRDIMAMWVS
jgi:hypothetical protein